MSIEDQRNWQATIENRCKKLKLPSDELTIGKLRGMFPQSFGSPDDALNGNIRLTRNPEDLGNQFLTDLLSSETYLTSLGKIEVKGFFEANCEVRKRKQETIAKLGELYARCGLAINAKEGNELGKSLYDEVRNLGVRDR